MTLKPVISLKEKNNLKRLHEPVTLGIPFKKGFLKMDKAVSLKDADDNEIPSQYRILDAWKDGSVKWMLLDFFASVDENSEKKYYLEISAPGRNLVPGKMEFESGKDGVIRIDTGKSCFSVDSRYFSPFLTVNTDGKEILGGSSEFSLTDNNNEEYLPEIDNILTEFTGEVRSTIRFEGAFRKDDKNLLRFISSMHFFRDKSYVKIDFTLWNDKPARHEGGLWDLGDPHSVLFKDLSLNININSDERLNCYWKTAPDEDMNMAESEYFSVYQGGSGGKNWQSRSHLNRDNTVPLELKGYKVRDGNEDIKNGNRAAPEVCLGNEKTGTSCVIDKFWQNFPKSISCDKNQIRIGIFPEQNNDLHELQGGERKTHTVWIDFSTDRSSLTFSNIPLLPMLLPEYYSGTSIFPYFSYNSEFRNGICENIIDGSINGKHSFFERREIIDEYGWRNFGDLFADHEAVGHEGESFISHYNNQYDPVSGAIRRYAESGDPGWHRLFSELAQHVRDIDIYHTTRDRDELNGGLFWHTNHYLDAFTCTHRAASKGHIDVLGDPNYGGGPGLEHNYSTGLMYCYYMTGDTFSKEAVLKLADWVINITNQPLTLLSAVYLIKTKLNLYKKVINGEKIRANKYPFTRESGNSINTLLDAYTLSKDKKYLERAEDIIKGCLHPEDDIESRDLLNAEPNWSYTVCLQSYGKFLDFKADNNEFDDLFYYARDTLLHYAKWMIENEYPYLDKPEILEYPNETWPAQDMRKCNVFLFAAKYSPEDIKKDFLKKAEFFYNYSITKLNEFDTRNLTRPIILLLYNYYMYPFFMEFKDSVSPDFADKKTSFPKHNEFLTIPGIIGRVTGYLFKGLIHTSPKKELEWLKCRLYKQG